MKNKFIYLIGLTAIILASIAAYCSVSGLSTLFSGAYFAIIIMLSGLEFAKIMTATLLHRYWNQLRPLLKVYLTAGVIILMFITSAGVYGFLSAAYSNVANKSVINTTQIEFLEKKKQTWIDKNSRLEKSIKEKTGRISNLSSIRSSQERRIDTLYQKGRGVKSTTESIKNIEKDITQLTIQSDELYKQIQIGSDSISAIDLSILQLNNKEIGGEIGPLKYVAILTGQDISKVVNFLILMLVFVFDPLAICLVIATNTLLEKQKGKIIPVYDSKEKSISEINYPLNQNSVIISISNDVNWIWKIYNLYECLIYVCEPIEEDYNLLVNEFKNNPKIILFNLDMTRNSLMKFTHLFNSQRIKQVDVLKINIEDKIKQKELINLLQNSDIGKKIITYETL